MLSDATLSPLKDCFQACRLQLLAFLARKTGNAEDARELTQELWLTVQRHDTDEGLHADNPRAYLFTIARNLAIDHLRRNTLASEHAQAYHDLHAGEVSSTGTPELMAQRQVLMAVQNALEVLPARTRDVFIDHRVHGIGQDELAGRHGVTRSTIERDVMRASRAMQDVLATWHRCGAVDVTSLPRRRTLVGSLLGASALTVGLGLLWSRVRHDLVQWQETLVSARGEMIVRTLPDGSRITLDASSRVTVRYYTATRQVTLHAGAIFVDVVRSPGRPFTVDARDVQVSVLGTRFGVDIQPGPTRPVVEVTVEAGQVQVAQRVSDANVPDWPDTQLAAGDVLRVGPDVMPPRRTHQPPSQAAPWRNGELTFRATSLGEVADRLHRHVDADIAITPRAARLPVTGHIRIKDADQWLRLLPDMLPVSVNHQAATNGRRRCVSIALRDEKSAQP